jgi:hypothetical protein
VRVATVSSVVALVALVAFGVVAPGASAATSVSNVTVDNTSPTTSAQALTTYVVGFKTSASGALSGDAGDHADFAFPAGTIVSNTTGSPLMRGATQVGGCGDTGALTVGCSVYAGVTVPASTVLTAFINGVNNPSTVGSYKLKVSTTKDTAQVTSPSYTVTAVTTITNVTAVNTSPTTSARGLTTYSVGLQTSAHGALVGDTGSAVLVTFPSGTGVSNETGSPLMRGAVQVGGCGNVGTLTVTCHVYAGTNVPASSALTAVINGVNNPPSVGSYTLKVSTTSDVTNVTSPSVNVTAETGISHVTVTPSRVATGTTNVTYTVALQIATALAGDTGSNVSIVFPAGTGVTSLSTSTLFDGATQIAGCARLNATQTVECDVYAGSVAHAGDTLTATINGVKNPSTTKQYAVKVSTTSDAIVKSVPYCIAAAGVPCITKFSPTSGQVTDAVTIVGLNLNGASAVKFNGKMAVVGNGTAKKITTTVPNGATTGPISVTTGGGTATTTKVFTVVP